MEEFNRILVSLEKYSVIISSHVGFIFYEQAKDEFGLSLPVTKHTRNNNIFLHWSKNNQSHREERDKNGLTLPAFISTNGYKAWYKDGKRHREDKNEYGELLPAYISGYGTEAFYINGLEQKKFYTPEINNRIKINSSMQQTVNQKEREELLQTRKEREELLQLKEHNQTERNKKALFQNSIELGKRLKV